MPNAGKSSLYNALTGGGALAAPYPFATKDPNIGVAKVPDDRLDQLAFLHEFAQLATRARDWDSLMRTLVDRTTEAMGVEVWGISPDGSASHAAFRAKFGLPFTLLSDAGHATAEAWGAWGEKSNYGKTYFGIIRSTFLVDPDGNIAKVWAKVKPEGHAAEVLAALDDLQPAR